MSGDIEETIKRCSTYMEFQQMQSKNKVIPHGISGKQWEMVDTVIFTLNNCHLLCLVDYQCEFPIVRGGSVSRTSNKILQDHIC